MSAYVAVVGPSGATRAEIALAEDIGRLLASAGAVVVTGGLGGVMTAAVRGASEANGRTVAVLPGSDREAAVADATVVLATGLGELRNGVLVTSADAVIAVGGSWGTLSEVALARRAGKPVIAVQGWTVAGPAGEDVVLPTADSATAAVDYVLGLIG